MKQFAVYALIAAAAVALLWPGSRAGQAVTSVTSSLAGVLRTGGTS